MFKIRGPNSLTNAFTYTGKNYGMDDSLHSTLFEAAIFDPQAQ